MNRKLAIGLAITGILVIIFVLLRADTLQDKRETSQELDRQMTRTWQQATIEALGD